MDPQTGAVRLAAIIVLAAFLALFDRDTAAQPPAGAVREIAMTAQRFDFKPNVIEVPFGTRVRLTVTSVDWAHGFELKPFGIRKEIPKGGKPVVIEFTANRSGTIEFACWDYCGRDHNGMKGKLIVTPSGGGR